MAKQQWMRAGEAPDTIRITIAVSRKDNPELLEWYWRLPFGGASDILRSILEQAVKTSGVLGQTQSRQNPPKPRNTQVAQVAQVVTPSEAASPEAPAAAEGATPVTENAQGVGKITDELAALMLEMDKNF